MTTAIQSISSKLASPFRLPGLRRLLFRDSQTPLEVDDQTLDLISDASPDTKAPAAKAEPEVHWADWRIELMERLWGKGFLLPGGIDFVSELTKPLNLGSKASVLVLNAGMGGPSNCIAEEFGAFIDGIEPDPELAAASTERAAVVKGMSRVSIKNIAIDDDKAFDRKYDAIFGQEVLLQIADKPQLLNHCVKALKDNGKLVLTDFTSSDDTNAKATATWLKREEALAPTTGEDEMRALLKDTGFSVRAVEDMTERYVGLVLDGWVALQESLRENAANKNTLLGMLEEAERWALRVALLKADQLRYTRMFATKKKKF